MIRHVIHDNDCCRLVVEVDVGIVTLTLFFGGAPPMGGFSSYAAVHLSPTDARKRLDFALLCLEGLGHAATKGPCEVLAARRVPLDTLHRSIIDITGRPTA